MLKRLAGHASELLQQPLRALLYLSAVALGVELAQYVPEYLPGGHAVGEIVRNLAYALIGAVVFHWLIVEIPGKRRRVATYAFNEMAFRLLLISGPGLLYQYQHAAKLLGEGLDIWDEASLSAFAKKLNAALPTAFGPERAGLLKSTVELGVPRSLAELSRSASYFDPEVAHALSLFPLQEGITVLQVRRTPSGGVEPTQDAHITWSLLEAARRLYPALLASGAYSPSIFEGYVGDPPVPLTPDVLIKDGPAQPTKA